MGLFKGALVVAALAVASPIWAHGGHGNDRGRDHDRSSAHHHRWDRDDYGRGWAHNRHHHRHWDRAPRQYYYNQHYYAPQYGYIAPAPGVHIVAPNVYIPFR